MNDHDEFFRNLDRKLHKDPEVLRRVMRAGACWYQHSMPHGPLLGSPVLVVVPKQKISLALDGVCIDEEGAVYPQNVYADGVLDKNVTPAEVEAHIKRAVAYFEAELRMTCRHVLLQVLPRKETKRKGSGVA